MEGSIHRDRISKSIKIASKLQQMRIKKLEQNQRLPISETKTFWREPGRTAALKLWCRRLAEADLLTPSVLADALKSDARQFTASTPVACHGGLVEDPDPMTLWHFITGETKQPRKAALLSQILLYLRGRLRRSDNRYKQIFARLDRKPAGAMSELLADFDDFCRSHGILVGALATKGRPTSQAMEQLGIDLQLHGGKAGVRQTVENVQKLFQIEKPCADIDRLIFGEIEGSYHQIAEPRLRCFEVFRNSTDPEKMAHMYCQLESSSAEWPLPRFRIFYSNTSDNDFETNGIIMAGPDTIYLFGGMNGLGINLIAIPSESISQSEFPGLQLGPNGSGLDFAARLVFVSTAVSDSRKLPTRMIDRAIAEERMPRPELIAATANRVRAIRSDIRVDGAAVDLGTLKRKVADHLNGPRGDALLTYPNGNPFNPVDEEHLAFDTSLSMLKRL